MTVPADTDSPTQVDMRHYSCICKQRDLRALTIPYQAYKAKTRTFLLRCM